MISFYSKETINYDSEFNLDEKIFNNLYGKIYKGAINVVDISNDATKESIIEAKGQIINNDRALFMICFPWNSDINIKVILAIFNKKEILVIDRNFDQKMGYVSLFLKFDKPINEENFYDTRITLFI